MDSSTLSAFRSALYGCFLKCSDALMNAVDALFTDCAAQSGSGVASTKPSRKEMARRGVFVVETRACACCPKIGSCVHFFAPFRVFRG